MGEIIRFRRRRKPSAVSFPGGTGSRRSATPIIRGAVACGVLASAAIAGFALAQAGNKPTDMAMLVAAAPAASAARREKATTRHFSVCAGGPRIDCVVDGDTFYLDGVKIRVADIDTPETGQPKCRQEAQLGARATLRFQQLLNDGPIELATIERDADRYGRKLRTVHGGGRSLGDVLVAEGLAHRWIGRKQSWCG